MPRSRRSRPSSKPASSRSRASTARPWRSSARHGRRRAAGRTKRRATSDGCSPKAGWAVITGGGPGVMEGRQSRRQGGRRPLGRLQHQAAARAGRKPLLRHHAHLRPLLCAQGLLRPPVGGLRHLPGRFRHARRALRVADADPDPHDPLLPGRPVRLRLLGRDGRLDPRRAARRRDDLRAGHRAAAPHRRPRGRGRPRARVPRAQARGLGATRRTGPRSRARAGSAPARRCLAPP